MPNHFPAHDRHHRLALQRPAVKRAVVRFARRISRSKHPFPLRIKHRHVRIRARRFNVPFSNRSNRAGATVNFAINSAKRQPFRVVQLHQRQRQFRFQAR